MKIDTAALHAHRAADDIDGGPPSGEHMDYLSARAGTRTTSAGSPRRCARRSTLILDAHGASGFADSSPMQRIWRDANTAGRHAIANPLVNQEVYGKALLGIGLEGQVTDLV